MSILSQLTLSEIVRLYNAICESKGTKTVSKFSERKVGEQRLQNLTLGMERSTLIDFCNRAKLRQEVIESLPKVAAPVEPIVVPAPPPPPVVAPKKKATKAAALVQTEAKPQTTQPIKTAKPVAQASSLDSEDTPQMRGRAKLVVLAAVRRLIPSGAKGEDAVTTSTLVAKHLRTSTTAVIRELERLGSSKLVKLEDDSPDPSNRLFYISLTPAGKAHELPADLLPAVVVVPSPTAKPSNPAPGTGKKVLPQPAPGPSSKFSGKQIYRLGEHKTTNPRREGTHGWKSFSVIKDGMTFEDYRDSGGRNNDLQWDVDHGYVEVR